jgi:hypothetical protein
MAGKTRHGSLGEQLKATWEYHNRPEHIEPMQTNWATIAANDNNPEDTADFGHERFLRISPSVEEIMRQANTGEIERNGAGQVVRIGKLRFSDGTQTEKAYTYGPDGKLIRFDAPMPVGAMLGTRDELEGALGGTSKAGETQRSNEYFADVLNVGLPRFVKSSGRRKGRNFTRDEAAAMLAQAVANTATMPAVTLCPPALPCGSQSPTECFLGMRKAKKGESGSIGWEDLATLKSNRARWREVKAALKPKSKRTLDAAAKAKNMREVGEVFGFAGKHAERRGKAALIAANDDLMAAINSAAA